MAGVKDRVFGSDIPVLVKKKLEARQKLAEKMQPGDTKIKPSDYPDDRTAYYTFDELNKRSFTDDDVQDLSTRTPFARMWTHIGAWQDTLVEDKEYTKEEQREMLTDLEEDQFLLTLKLTILKMLLIMPIKKLLLKNNGKMPKHLQVA